MFNRRFYVQAADGDGASAGGGAAGAGDAGAGGAAAGAGGAGAAGAGGDNGAPAPGAAGAGSALAAGAAAAGAASGGAGAAGGTAGAAEPNAWVPEKHRVVGQDGKLDIEASARKVAEAYGQLERRLGSGEAPPKTAEEYKVTIPADLAEKIKAEDLQKDAGFKADIAKLHAAGASQATVDAYVDAMLHRGVSMREGAAVMARAECEAALRTEEGWKSDQEYTKRMGDAYHAAKTYAANEGDFTGILKDYGNDPRIARLLANVGAELQEDRGGNPDESAQVQESLDTLMNSKAFLNSNDPQHQATLDKVTALTARLTGNKSVASGKTMSFKSG